MADRVEEKVDQTEDVQTSAVVRSMVVVAQWDLLLVVVLCSKLVLNHI